MDYEPHPWFSFFEMAKELSPETSRVFISEIWTNTSLKEAINKAHAHKTLSLSSSTFDLRSQLHQAALDFEVSRTQNQLLKESTKQYKELEKLNTNLEKIVEERTLHIQNSTVEIAEKLERIRHLIRFIKDLSQSLSFEDMMNLIRNELKKFAKLRDPILVIQTDKNKNEIYFYQAGHLNNHSSDKNWQIPGQIKIQDKNLMMTLANHFGRPFVSIICFPIETRLMKNFINENAAAILLIEHSLSESELDEFMESMSEFLKPISMAIDRAFLENELISQSFRWEKTFDGIKDPIAIIDSEYNVIRSNNKFSDRMILKKCYDIFANSEKPCVDCPLSLSIESKKSQSAQIKHNGKIFEVHTYPIQLSTENRVNTVVNQYIDVTDSRTLYMRMVQNEKMGAIGLLAGHIAHELNNPLTGIRSLSQVLISQMKDRPQVRQDLIEVEKAAMRSQKIIKNLLDFSNSERKELVKINWCELVDKTMPILKTVIRNHRVLINLEKNQDQFMTDANLVQQVVFNLINNACQSMKDKGTLTVESIYQEDSKWTYLSIQDTGPGIQKEMHEKIFEPFFTTKAEGQGTGLGLSLSKSIIESLGGKILLNSIEGQGSQFIIQLPKRLKTEDL